MSEATKREFRRLAGLDGAVRVPAIGPRAVLSEIQGQIATRPTTRIRAAVRCERMKDLVVGVRDDDDAVIVFRRSDYDNRGNLDGPFGVVSNDDRAFYVLGYEALPGKESEARNLDALARRALENAS